MLYLFDIDGTLVDTGGAGMAALRQATREIFGGDGPPLDLAGATDLAIVASIHAHFGVDASRDRFDAYFATYQKHLDHNLAAGTYPGRAIEGAAVLLEHLAKRDGATLGLLTGNTAAGAASKVRHFGFARHFAFGAFGCDHADRNRLGPIALERAAAHAGRSFSPGETWIIGDTPKDIACARAIGAKCLAVATGGFTTSQLSAHGADLVVVSLEEAIRLI
jgi:phosphoglycolate phosphatase